jgi:hypothetical protein
MRQATTLRRPEDNHARSNRRHPLRCGVLADAECISRDQVQAIPALRRRPGDGEDLRMPFGRVAALLLLPRRPILSHVGRQLSAVAQSAKSLTPPGFASLNPSHSTIATDRASTIAGDGGGAAGLPRCTYARRRFPSSACRTDGSGNGSWCRHSVQPPSNDGAHAAWRR